MERNHLAFDANLIFFSQDYVKANHSAIQNFANFFEVVTLFEGGWAAARATGVTLGFVCHN